MPIIIQEPRTALVSPEIHFLERMESFQVVLQGGTRRSCVSDESEWAAISEVARLVGVGTAGTVRKWVRHAQVDAGARTGLETAPS